MLRRSLMLVSVAAAAAVAFSPAHAAYPERTITVVCASGAGGAVDVTTRIITDHMAKTLGQNIVVQNEHRHARTTAGLRVFEHLLITGGVAKRGVGPPSDKEVNTFGLAGMVVDELDLGHPDDLRDAVAQLVLWYN